MFILFFHIIINVSLNSLSSLWLMWCKILCSAYLRPSRELLEYYRKKIAEFDDEHESMLQRLEHYKMTYEEQV